MGWYYAGAAALLPVAWLLLYLLGKRTKVDAWLVKVLLAAFIAAFFLLSIVPHILFRAVGLRGFYNKRTREYKGQNPFVRER